jgi:4-aminobutyrate aminotransferase/(S)-3-amino-2-methylpropionate transaminase
LWSAAQDVAADLICLGKGLGGGLPISACVGTEAVMLAWQRDDEVVHTSTFAGAPLACAAALAMLGLLQREQLVERSLVVGEQWRQSMQERLRGLPEIQVRGAGLMLGIAHRGRPGWATAVARALLQRGYLVSTGGGAREVVILTPALTIAEEQLASFGRQLHDLLRRPLPS